MASRIERSNRGIHRFFVECPIRGAFAEISAGEAHHALHVMRLRVGDEAVLFDGSGEECLARITKMERSRVKFEILERQQVDRELPFRLSIGVAMPKGDRQRWLVEKLAELGVTELTPLETSRGSPQPAGKALKRLERTVIEACKQCGRNRLMRITEPQTLSDFSKPVRDDELMLIGDPSGCHWNTLPTGLGDTRLLIGPEGGFSASETAAAQRSAWRPFSLGPRILRIETAAIQTAGLLAVRQRS